MPDTVDTLQVLYVDGDPACGDAVADRLRGELERFAVTTATDAESGLALLADESFDCVVSEYELPGMDGISFLEQVREADPPLPFVLFTDAGNESVASEAIAAGVTDYVRKTGEVQQYALLAKRLRNAVERARARRDRRRHLDAIETAQEGISILDDDHRFVYVNRAYADCYGYEPEEMLGEHFELVYREEDVAYIHEEILPALLETGNWQGTTIGLRADGSTFLEDHHLATTEDGGLVCTIRNAGERSDVPIGLVGTERESYDAQTRERRLRALNETARELMGAWTVERVVEIGVESANGVLGLEANGIHLYDEEIDGLVPAAQTERGEGLVNEPPTLTAGSSIAWRVFESGDSLAYDDVHRDPAVHNPESRIQSELFLPIGSYGILIASSESPRAFTQEDVIMGEILVGSIETALEQVEQTEQLRARERELERQNERLEEFAAIVSHDLRNPLQIAEGRVEMVIEDGDTAALGEVSAALERMESLIDDLLLLAREGDHLGETKLVRLDSVAEECWRTVDSGEASLHVHTDSIVHVDPGRLRQVFENLFRNAVEHNGPDVSITVGPLEDGFYVEDDGRGIPAAEREQIFDIGYSTSPDGTGLGLNIVQQVVDAHSWSIDIGEGDAGGARFEITDVPAVE